MDIWIEGWMDRWIDSNMGGWMDIYRVNPTQRQAIYRDPAWRGDYYGDDAPPTDGLCVARQSAMISIYISLYYLNICL